MLCNVVLISTLQTRISHKYMYISSLLCFPPSPYPHPTPLGHHRVLGWAPCYMAASHYLSISHMAIYILQCYFLSSSQPLFPPLEEGSALSRFSAWVQVPRRRQSWTDVCSPGSREGRATSAHDPPWKTALHPFQGPGCL